MTSLSVIIPFYKDFAFIEQAVNSVLVQGVTDFEIIIVNDNPGKFSQQFLGDCRFPGLVNIITHETNRGLSAARNTGLSNAAGEYIAYLDGDDYYLHGGLRTHHEAAKKHGSDVTHATTLMRYRDEHGMIIERMNQRDAQLFNKLTPNVNLNNFPQMQFIISSWKSIYRKEHLVQNNIAFDEAQRKFEDRLYVLDNVFSGAEVSFIPGATRVWRRRAGSITSAQKTDADIKMMAALVHKCVDRVKLATQRDGYHQNYLKREVFHAAWRIMWDSDLLNIALNDTSTARSIRPLLSEALGTVQPHPELFRDAVASEIDRSGLPGPSGLTLDHNSFSQIWTLVAEQRWEQLQAHVASVTSGMAKPVMPPKKSLALPPSRIRKQSATKSLNDVELIMHIGMHKTGTTFLQHKFDGFREQLTRQSILFPKTGFVRSHTDGAKSGATPGHQGIVNAIVHGDGSVKNQLLSEIRSSSCNKLLISCENLCFPYQSAAERQRRCNEADKFFSQFPNRRVIGVVRRPDQYFEALYREKITNLALSETRSARHFLASFGDALLNYEDMLAPWAAFAGGNIQLLTYTKVGGTTDYFKEFCRVFNICDVDILGDTGDSKNQNYKTPGRDLIEALRLVNALTPPGAKKRQVVSDLLQVASLHEQNSLSALSPDERLAMLEIFEQKSKNYLLENGVNLDLAATRLELEREGKSWLPPDGIQLSLLQPVFYQDNVGNRVSTERFKGTGRRLATFFHRQRNSPATRSVLLKIYAKLPASLKTLARGLYAKITQ